MPTIVNEQQSTTKVIVAGFNAIEETCFGTLYINPFRYSTWLNRAVNGSISILPTVVFLAVREEMEEAFGGALLIEV